MRKKQEPSPVERRSRRPAFADVVLSDANSNDASKSGGIELLYPNGVRILLPLGMHDAEELMSYVKAYGNFTFDLEHFPGFRVLVSSSPENLPYDK